MNLVRDCLTHKISDVVKERLTRLLLHRCPPSPFRYETPGDDTRTFEEGEANDEKWKQDGNTKEHSLWHNALYQYQCWLYRRELVNCKEEEKENHRTDPPRFGNLGGNDHRGRVNLFHLCQELNDGGDVTRYDDALSGYVANRPHAEELDESLVIRGPCKTLDLCCPREPVWLVADGGHGAQDCWYDTNITSDAEKARALVAKRQAQATDSYTFYGAREYPLDKLL